MKNVIKTISYIAVAAFAVVAIAMVTASSASAAAEFANGNLSTGQSASGNGECPIAMIGNATTGEGVHTGSGEPCWGTQNITADAGDTVNLKIKLKNLGASGEHIGNAKFRVTGFNPNSTTPVSGENFTVTLSGNGVVSASSTIGFSINGNSQTLTYLGYQERYYDVSIGGYVGSAFQNSSTGVFGNGQIINANTLEAGDYVYITMAFKVGNASTPDYNPTVTVSGPNSVTSGSSATISWSTNNDVDECTFTSSPSVSQWNTNTAISGSESYVLNQTTIFTATCYAPDGTQVQDSHTVNVTNGGGNLPQVTIDASDTSITLGDKVNISWTIDNATSCVYDATPNFSTFDGQGGTNDSTLMNITLSQDTEFTITCTNQYGSDTDYVTVYVNDGNGNNGDEPDATTDNAQDVDNNSAELNGSVDMNDFNNGFVFFVYGQNESDVEDVEDEDAYSDIDNDGQDLRKVKADGDLDSIDGEEDYSENVSGLDTNKTYYFRTCVEYVDADGDDALACGKVKKFNTNGNSTVVINQPNNGGVDPVINPLAVTLPESNVTQNSVILNGGYNANGCQNFSTQFYLGTSTSNMNIHTSIVSRGNTSGIMRESIAGLAAGTTYYSRAVGFCNGIPVYGDFEQFRTPGNAVFSSSNSSTVSRAVVSNATKTITSTTLDAGSGLGCLDLEITNNTDGVSRGQTVVYNVQWTNLCKQDFEDAVIDVKLAEGLEFLATTRGTYSGIKENSVIADLGDIQSQEEGEMVITARVRPAANLGDVLVVEANLGGDGIGNGIQDTAIEFDFDQVYETGFGGLAAAAFGSGFLFGSVWGWLLILLLLAGLILAARYFYVNGKRDERNGYYGYAPAYAQAPVYQQPQYMMQAPQQPMYHAPQAPMYAPVAAPMAPAPANLPNMNMMHAAPVAPVAPEYVPYRPAPFDGSQNA